MLIIINIKHFQISPASTVQHVV